MSEGPRIPADLGKAICTEIALYLDDRRERVYAELRNYPTPIAACDQQFNYLLEVQAQVCEELGRIGKLLSDGPAAADSNAILDDFLRSSRAIDDETKQRLRSNLKDPGSAPAPRR